MSLVLHFPVAGGAIAADMGGILFRIAKVLPAGTQTNGRFAVSRVE